MPIHFGNVFTSAVLYHMKNIMDMRSRGMTRVTEYTGRKLSKTEARRLEDGENYLNAIIVVSTWQTGPVPQDFPGRIMARNAGNTASGMGGRAALVESANG